MEFKRYRKCVPTSARVLTEQDYAQRNGMIQTLEGPKSFCAGDYLARDAKGEWPIQQATIREKYTQTAPEDEHGYAHYLRLSTNLAVLMPVAFTIEGLTGKAGDYLVLSEGSGWPVDRELFEQTYTPA